MSTDNLRNLQHLNPSVISRMLSGEFERNFYFMQMMKMTMFTIFINIFC